MTRRIHEFWNGAGGKKRQHDGAVHVESRGFPGISKDHRDRKRISGGNGNFDFWRFRVDIPVNPSSLVNSEIPVGVLPLESIYARDRNSREYADTFKESPTSPPWGFLGLTATGLLAGIWGWCTDRRWSPVTFFGGLVLWIVGLCVVLPWWANR
jgi:hypothetical protein